MKLTGMCAALCAAGLLLTGCGGPEKTVDATAEAKPIVEKLYQAWGTLDMAKVAPFYAKDATFVFYDIAPLKYEGWAAYSKGFEAASKSLDSIKVTLNPDFKAWRQADLMVASATAQYEIHPKSGPLQTGTMRLTEVLERHSGGWVVMHEHVSVPYAEPAPAPKEEPKPKVPPHPTKGRKHKR